MADQITKTQSRWREVMSEDGSSYLSAGRVGMFSCLFFSMVFSIAGLHYSENDKVLSYCSLIALQFLGTGVIFYGSTKTSEAFKAKWIPDPISMDSKITAIVNKVVSVGDAKLREPAKEVPEIEEVK